MQSLGATFQRMARLYCVQHCDIVAGWQDVPGGAFSKEHAAIRHMDEVRPEYGRAVLRVIRKPHGWEPPKPLEPVVTEPPAWSVWKWPECIPREAEQLEAMTRASLQAVWIEQDKPTMAQVLDGGFQQFWEALVRKANAVGAGSVESVYLYAMGIPPHAPGS